MVSRLYGNQTCISLGGLPSQGGEALPQTQAKRPLSSAALSCKAASTTSWGDVSESPDCRDEEPEALCGVLKTGRFPFCTLHFQIPLCSCATPVSLALLPMRGQHYSQSNACMQSNPCTLPSHQHDSLPSRKDRDVSIWCHDSTTFPCVLHE